MTESRTRTYMRELAELRKCVEPIHAARLDTVGCAPVSLHRADLSETAAHDESCGPCACRACDDRRREQVKRMAERILSRLPDVLLDDRDRPALVRQSSTDLASGVRELPANDNDRRETLRPPRMERAS